MPSQSSFEGESTPDHWIVTGSPDLERVCGDTEMETSKAEGVQRRDRRRERMIEEVTGIIIFFFFLPLFLGDKFRDGLRLVTTL